MLKQFFPDIHIQSVHALPLEELKKRDIKVLFFDIDNTVAPFDVAEADDRTVELFEKLKDEGFEICLISNNSEERVEKYNEKLKVRAIARAGKPGTKKLKEVLRELNATEKEGVLIGDQVFTDVYCARRAGMLAVLTEPICDRDQFVTKVKRGAERQVLKRYQRSLKK